MSSYHPDGLTVDVVGIIAPDRGRNCDEHPFCGEIVALDIVVRFRCEMIHVAGGTDGGPGREEPAIVVYWVTNGIDACRIGFLPRHMNHHAARYDGVLGQITGTFSASHPNHAVREKWHRNMGFCRAAVISPLNGDAMVVEVAGGGVAALGEVPAGVEAAELAKKFCLGGPLPRGIHSSYFRHWKPMNVSPYLRDGVFVELTAVGDSDNSVNADANWKRVITKKKECEAAVLAILEAPDSLPILLTTHQVWKTKKNVTRLKSINKITTVFVPRISSVFLGCIEKNTGVWSMLMIQCRLRSGPRSIGRINSWNSVASSPTSLGERCTLVPMRYTSECFFQEAARYHNPRKGRLCLLHDRQDAASFDDDRETQND
jgi:hypothetical protein